MQCGTGLCGHCQLGPLLLCRDGLVVGYPTAEPLLLAKGAVKPTVAERPKLTRRGGCR